MFCACQVRQQSKDVATLVRQKVQTEREKQLGLVKERVSAQTQQWQVQKLKALHKEYESTLKNVGKGHSDAAYQVCGLLVNFIGNITALFLFCA